MRPIAGRRVVETGQKLPAECCALNLIDGQIFRHPSSCDTSPKSHVNGFVVSRLEHKSQVRCKGGIHRPAQGAHHTGGVGGHLSTVSGVGGAIARVGRREVKVTVDLWNMYERTELFGRPYHFHTTSSDCRFPPETVGVVNQTHWCLDLNALARILEEFCKDCFQAH